MASHSELVADTLDILDGFRQDPVEIDEAYVNGSLSGHDLVMTSMGNQTRAVITPAYPGIAFEPQLLHRFNWASIYERPFVEAALRVSQDEDGALIAATVGLRFCLRPRLDRGSSVLQTVARFSLDQNREYGTTESVLEAIRSVRDEGVSIGGQSGIIIVPESEKRSKTKWAVSRNTLNELSVASAIYGSVVEDLKFKEL